MSEPQREQSAALRAVFTNDVIRAIGALARQQNVCREQDGAVVFVTGMEAAREYIVEHVKEAQQVPALQDVAVSDDADAATSELLSALDELYPLPDDAKRAERAGRTCAALKRWMAFRTDELQALIPKIAARLGIEASVAPAPQEAELRALLAKWRAESDKDYETRHGDDSGGIWAYQHEAAGRYRKARQCADELEAVLAARLPTEASAAAQETPVVLLASSECGECHSHEFVGVYSTWAAAEEAARAEARMRHWPRPKQWIRDRTNPQPFWTADKLVIRQLAAASAGTAPQEEQ